MKYIECKAQWLSRPLTTKTSMSGFEGPAASTELDDGFGVPMMKGMLTPSYQCFFKETGMVDNSPVYDGTIDIPDTKSNRYKIAIHVRARDLRVKDRNLERQILADNPTVSRDLAPKPHSILADMPEDFDGSKVVVRSANMAIVDEDPIEDPHAAVQDAEFTDVPPVDPKDVSQSEKDEAENVVRMGFTSAAQAQAGQVTKPATEPPKGFDAKALKARAEQAQAAQDKPVDKE